ncbi:hypothetical protein FVB9532_03510 [Mesonia oceanica]|uniref:Uncharacterized protein n=1 Tax=Mesonia oceanica TaxID=2687242 RepID=A0AC61YCH4_9FLAO|nr:hypothetical protein FVB9532_03510 [Mesonia oceanica]
MIKTTPTPYSADGNTLDKPSSTPSAAELICFATDIKSMPEWSITMCRQSEPDSGSHLQSLFLKFGMRLRVEPVCRTGRPGMTQNKPYCENSRNELKCFMLQYISIQNLLGFLLRFWGLRWFDSHSDYKFLSFWYALTAPHPNLVCVGDRFGRFPARAEV